MDYRRWLSQKRFGKTIFKLTQFFLGILTKSRSLIFCRERTCCLCRASVKVGVLLSLRPMRWELRQLHNDVHGLRDSIQNHVTGLLTKKNTPEDLARCAITLLRDRTLLESYSNAALENSMEFDWIRLLPPLKR
jgi:hypothetical protein